MIAEILQDAIFAAIAATGFAAISHPPGRAYWACALTAAIGHSLRFILTNVISQPLHIVPATLIAALVVGLLAVFLSPVTRTPAETGLFPALLPMIPGIYAYKAFGGLAMSILSATPEAFDHYHSLFASNGLTCLAILLSLTIGGTIPIFAFKNISFHATRTRPLDIKNS
ncbi:MAG: threonine/serine exporter family protein [Muribaculaceae bacterium]|nr:threonine/serine exporter family protein [Muribaculaceae bacterium]